MTSEQRRGYYLRSKERALALDRVWKNFNRVRWMATRKEHRRKLRLAVLAKFGNKCAICGFDNPRALQIDHVFGDGKADRKAYSNGATPKYLRKILEDTSGMYQLLCANCNILKYWESK